jgi:magnesium chelatase subunit I
MRRCASRCKRADCEQGEATPIAWLTPDDRYVEKLATPDVTVADLIGDLDPIKAARGGHDLASEFTMHYGLLPRANRGIFAVNELPDLAGKIQVALFNIMQEGDIQIKGYPVRLALDVALVFSANPEDYTARGKIVTPLKDRIGSEIRTHYPATVEEGIAITSAGGVDSSRAGASWDRLRFRIFCARSWSRWPFWRAKTSGWTSAAA